MSPSLLHGSLPWLDGSKSIGPHHSTSPWNLGPFPKTSPASQFTWPSVRLPPSLLLIAVRWPLQPTPLHLSPPLHPKDVSPDPAISSSGSISSIRQEDKECIKYQVSLAESMKLDSAHCREHGPLSDRARPPRTTPSPTYPSYMSDYGPGALPTK